MKHLKYILTNNGFDNISRYETFPFTLNIIELINKLSGKNYSQTVGSGTVFTIIYKYMDIINKNYKKLLYLDTDIKTNEDIENIIEYFKMGDFINISIMDEYDIANL